MFEKITPLEKEWKKLLRQERLLIGKMEKAGEPFWERKLNKIVPEKLQEILEEAFYKGFKTIFNSGTGILEKTFSREKLEAEFKTREYAQELYSTRKNLAAVKKAAGKQKAGSVIGAGAEGAALGLLGIGLPDIVFFLGVLLRTLYKLALNYGIDYERADERELLLDLIVLSLHRGKGIREVDAGMNRRLYAAASKKPENREPEPTGRDEPIRRAARALSGELLYLKFLQGLPVIGAVGGICDGICLKKITDYASIKMERRYLLSKIERQKSKL